MLEETEVVKEDKYGYLSKKDGDREEVVVSMTGVLVEASLPPYKNLAE